MRCMDSLAATAVPCGKQAAANGSKTDDFKRERRVFSWFMIYLVIVPINYPGDYLRTANPSIERIAETVDKMEEDVLQRHTGGKSMLQRFFPAEL